MQQKGHLNLPLLLAASAAHAQISTPTVTVTKPDSTTTQIGLTPGAPVGTGVVGTASGVIAMPPTQFVKVNAAGLMKPRVGYNTLRIQGQGGVSPNAEPAGWAGSFRLNCNFSHMLFDDPIIYPGWQGVSHLHVFFGDSDINGLTPSTQLLENTDHRSTCDGGTANRSGYWVSAMIDTSTNLPIQPISNEVYYKEPFAYGQLNDPRPAHSPSELQVPPAGLRIIAGNPGNTAGDTFAQRPAEYNVAPTWSCNNINGTISAGQSHIPGAECPNGSQVIQLLQFPNCWDGVNLDSPDHKSHMAYSDDQGADGHRAGCPTSHPIPVIVPAYNIHYAVTAKSRPENWRLSSDNYSLSLPAGGSSHGDWIAGWNRSVIATFVANCIVAGFDCHTNLLGDGTTLY